nr:hypothetical protein [Tanacetum cinerariifolium]
MTESPLVDSDLVIRVFFLGDDPIACLNKAMAFLTAAAPSRGNNASGHTRIVKCNNYQDVEQLAFLADPGVPDGQAVQTIIPNNATFQTEDLDTYDSNCDNISNAKAVLMTNISNYGSYVISEVPHSEIYLNDMEIKLAVKEKVDALEQNLSKQIKEKELHTFTAFKRESKEKEDRNIENEIDLEKKIKELDNIIFKVGQSAQTVHMLTKPQGFYDNIHKQALEAPNELSKVSLVNKSLKKLKLHLANFNKVVKITTTPNARIEGEWGFEHTKAVFDNEIIQFLKSLKDIFNVFDKDLLNEIIEVQTVFDQMDSAVQ